MSFWNAILFVLRSLCLPITALYSLLKNVPWLRKAIGLICGWNVIIAYADNLFSIFVSWFGYFLSWLPLPTLSANPAQAISQWFVLIGDWNTILPIQETFFAVGIGLTYLLARFAIGALLWIVRRFFDVLP
ncbi:MAG: hypothetical protein J6X44_00755 [Thermoguttaceae bacterium]|nr:hypothetical protein [Thermoguttaceae bacterium]